MGWAGPRGPGLRNASDVSAYVAVDRPWSRLPPPRRPCLFPTKQKNQIAEQLRGEAPRRPAAPPPPPEREGLPDPPRQEGSYGGGGARVARFGSGNNFSPFFFLVLPRSKLAFFFSQRHYVV